MSKNGWPYQYFLQDVGKKRAMNSAWWRASWFDKLGSAGFLNLVRMSRHLCSARIVGRRNPSFDRRALQVDDNSKNFSAWLQFPPFEAVKRFSNSVKASISEKHDRECGVFDDSKRLERGDKGQSNVRSRHLAANAMNNYSPHYKLRNGRRTCTAKVNILTTFSLHIGDVESSKVRSITLIS